MAAGVPAAAVGGDEQVKRRLRDGDESAIGLIAAIAFIAAIIALIVIALPAFAR